MAEHPDVAGGRVPSSRAICPRSAPRRTSAPPRSGRGRGGGRGSRRADHGRGRHRRTARLRLEVAREPGQEFRPLAARPAAGSRSSSGRRRARRDASRSGCWTRPARRASRVVTSTSWTRSSAAARSRRRRRPKSRMRGAKRRASSASAALASSGSPCGDPACQVGVVDLRARPAVPAHAHGSMPPHTGTCHEPGGRYAAVSTRPRHAPGRFGRVTRPPSTTQPNRNHTKGGPDGHHERRIPHQRA